MAAKKRGFAKPEAFDHDGDGKPGGSLPKELRGPAETEAASGDAVGAAAPVSTTPKYDAAMAKRADGTLKRAVLTEKGWVTPADRTSDQV